MAEFKTYSDHSMSPLMGDREPILKSILRQLFEGIYEEIKDKCNSIMQLHFVQKKYAQ